MRDNFRSITITKSNIISFTLGMFGVMLMALLSSLGFHPGLALKSFIEDSHVVEQQVDVITPKIEAIKNKFSVYKKQSIVPQSYAAHEFEEATAYGAIDFDTGEVIIDKNLSAQLPIASITKVMTAVVALDLAGKDEVFTVSKDAAKIIPTKIGVVPGQKMRLEELLNAMLLVSANDAAEVIREGIDKKYGDEVFIDAMNKKAKFIGLSDSSFQNPQGFDSRLNYSTVEDLAVLTHYALANYPLIEEIVKKDYEFLPSDKNHKQYDLFNWNGLIGVYPNTSGVKIGSTGRAGKTTVVVSEREGKKIIAVVLGAPGILERDLWASQILDAGFEMTAGLEPINVDEIALQEKYDQWQYWN